MTRARALKHGLIALAALVSGGALAPAAWAGDAGCFWDKLPQAARERFVAGYPDTAGNKILDTLGGVEVVITAIKACGVPDQSNDDVLTAFTGETMIRGAAGRLKADYGIDEAALRAAWMATPAADQRVVCDDATKQGDDRGSASLAVETIVNGYLDRVALNNLKAEALAADWMVGMCMKAKGEAGF